MLLLNKDLSDECLNAKLKLTENRYVISNSQTNVHRVAKVTSCYNAIMVVTGRAHCVLKTVVYNMFKEWKRPNLYPLISTNHCRSSNF